MSERQMFDLLAQDAPVPGPSLADNVIDRAHQNRRRRWAVSGACAAVALIAAVPLAVALNRSPQSAPHAPPAAAAKHHSSGAPSHAPGTAPSEDSLVYAAGIKYLAHQLVAGKHWQVLFILDHTCTNGVSPSGPCHAQPISAGAQRELAAALQPYARVQFVSDHAKIRDKNLTVINDGVAVTLGRIQRTGNGAHVPMAVQCGGLCGLGETLVLAKKNGIWTVTGVTGPAWIS